MKLTAQEFLDQPRKVITFIGMSGVGKSYLACRLAEWGWLNYSCDYLIATEYLKTGVDVSPDNISNLSDFVGQIGAPDKGGMALEEFKKHQKEYYEAECAVLRDFAEALQGTDKHVINDSAGSFCEVLDEALIDEIGQQSLFVYLKVEPEQEATILERAVWTPKPLYFPEAFFEQHLAEFQKKTDARDIEDIEPEGFLRWVFPHLFKSRLPKYQKLADEYGVTINVSEITNVKSEDEFIEKVAKALL